MDARKIAIVVGVLAAMTGFGVVACDDSSNAVKEPVTTPDSGGPVAPGVDGGGGPQPGLDSGGPTLPDGAPSDCFMNPKTHLEIINACTDAVKITKNPTLALLLPDGGLPPTP
jgi:hypothetical protein